MADGLTNPPHADAVCDGGDLDCGSGLLLIIRNAMSPLESGGVLEVRSRETSVKEDLPAWCRMVGHEMLATLGAENRYTRYFIRKKGADPAAAKDMESARNYEWQVRAKWTHGMQAKVFCRNHSFIVGQPASFDTEDAAPSAVEYLLGALAGCLAVGLQWRLSQQNAGVYNLEVTLSAKSANILVFLGVEQEGNPGLHSITGHLYIDTDAAHDTVSRAWEQTVNRSPVLNSLIHPVPTRIDLRKV